MADFLNIDKYLETPPFNRIERVGLELEGGWTVVPKNCKFEADSSVQISRKLGDAALSYSGEAVSGPMLPVGFPTWMRKNYPQVVNKTCGLHVHMSFETARPYSILTAPEYQETVLEYLKRWGKEEGISAKHPLWTRLEGDQEYCRKLHWPDRQIRMNRKDHDREREGHRYTVINYCHGLHGTLECRVLSMFDDVETSIRAVRRVLDITNACLFILGAKREPKFRATVQLEDDHYEEFFETQVKL